MLFHRNVLGTVLFLTSIQSFGSASMDTVPPIHGSDETREWIKRIVGSLRQPWIEGFKSVLHTTESSCATEVAALIQAMESGHEWAFQMLDASSGLQTGLMKGNFRDVGLYDECVEANGQYNHVNIRGKHCMVSLGSASPTSPAVIGIDYLRILSSICVPSSCNETQVEQIVNATVANIPTISHLGLEASNAFCADVGSDDLSAGEIYTLITPSFVVVMLFVSFFINRFGNGPLWKIWIGDHVEICKKNWWFNMLYIQNFLKPELMCLLHTWYLAVNMQLFWLSPIVIYPLYRWPKHGIRILGLVLLASIFIPPIVLGINGYTNRTFTMHVDSGILDFGDLFNFYIPTYNRASAYFFGMFLGYDVATKKRQLTKVNVWINWAATSVLLLFCMCATHFNYNNAFAYNRVLEVVLALTLRPCWSVAIAWIIYACTHGYGGPINSFLSMPFFRPLSRLSFSTYLLHALIQSKRSAVAQTPVVFSNSLIVSLFLYNFRCSTCAFEIQPISSQIHEYLIDLVLSIVAAFVFTLFFESPLVVLEKIFVSSKSEVNRVTLVRGTDNGLQVKEEGIRKESTKKD
ncbi:nose resistant to fluoxetine protein 6-like isoform X5 [Neodiprion fabricii]|uniref:nose resistant to fluoxetine protein 6-like isoform X5 n=1 Tax=Neodiprion fabricii TaxID=2872261 RepID=UPI001ED9305C|nr:nose resistant to fluoxetine protein 6-like isoform X5 [Neodiprion fabricii]